MPIRSFKDLEVYQDSYSCAIVLHKELLFKLPNSEKFDLVDQLSRSSKAVPRLIAEGYAKRHQKKGFQKYIDDAMSEVNETLVGVEQIKDIYGIEVELCDDLVKKYDKTARQLYRLGQSWTDFKKRESSPNPNSMTIPASKPKTKPNEK